MAQHNRIQYFSFVACVGKCVCITVKSAPLSDPGLYLLMSDVWKTFSHVSTLTRSQIGFIRSTCRTISLLSPSLLLNSCLSHNVSPTLHSSSAVFPSCYSSCYEPLLNLYLSFCKSSVGARACLQVHLHPSSPRLLPRHFLIPPPSRPPPSPSISLPLHLSSVSFPHLFVFISLYFSWLRCPLLNPLPLLPLGFVSFASFLLMRRLRYANLPLNPFNLCVS